MIIMSLEHVITLLLSIHGIFLLSSVFENVASLRAHCDSYGVRNAMNDDADWMLYNITDTGKCSICLKGQRETKLLLPSFNRNRHPISRYIVKYAACSPGSSDKNILLHHDISSIICEMAYNNDQLPRATPPIESLKRCSTRNISFAVDQKDCAYYLQASMSTPNSFICLQKLRYIPMLIPTGISTASSFETTVTVMTTQKVNEKDQTATTMSNPSSKDNQTVTSVSETEQTVVTSTRSSFNSNQQTPRGRRQRNFPIWVIFVIFAVVMGLIVISAVVFIHLRKLNDHQPAIKESTGRDNGQSNGQRDNTRRNYGVTSNVTYGVGEAVTGKEGEYHSYAEIEAKKPNSNELIYNSAYESTPANSDMVYNCAYGSQEINGELIYNSTYESSASN